MKRGEGHYSRSDSGENFRQSRAVDLAGNPREPTRRALLIAGEVRRRRDGARLFEARAQAKHGRVTCPQSVHCPAARITFSKCARGSKNCSAIVGRKASGDQQQDEPAFRLAVTCIKMAERVQQFHRLVASWRHVAVSSRRRARKWWRCSISSPNTVLASRLNSSLSLSCGRNPGQQLLEYRNRAVTGQNLGIGNRRLDELADKLTKDCLADRALALAVRGGDRANSGESTALSLTGTVAVSPATPWGERDSGRSSYARSMRRLSMPDDLAFPRALHLR